LNAQDVQTRITALKEYRNNRNQDAVTAALERREEACSGGENVMEPMIESVKIGATIGEVNGVLRSVFGVWTSPRGVEYGRCINRSHRYCFRVYRGGQ